MTLKETVWQVTNPSGPASYISCYYNQDVICFSPSIMALITPAQRELRVCVCVGGGGGGGSDGIWQ